MLDEHWDPFVIFVNAYYAVQEAYDSARRDWEKPAEGLDVFCRDANPFLWDGKASAEEKIYEEFVTRFNRRFKTGSCRPEEGYAFAREWLGTLEGGDYGASLVAAFDQTADEREFTRACPAIARQLAARASHLERTPQDMPEPPAEPAKRTPSAADIDAVIDLLAGGDEAFAATLRARLEDNEA